MRQNNKSRINGSMPDKANLGRKYNEQGRNIS